MGITKRLFGLNKSSSSSSSPSSSSSSPASSSSSSKKSSLTISTGTGTTNTTTTATTAAAGERQYIPHCPSPLRHFDSALYSREDKCSSATPSLSRSLKERVRKEVELKLLPNEIWTRITTYLPDPSVLSRTSRSTYRLLSDPLVRQQVLYGIYGVKLCLYQAYTHRRRILLTTPGLATLLIRGGAIVPRFLAQQITKKNVGVPTDALSDMDRVIVAEAERCYGPRSTWEGLDDVADFETWSNAVEDGKGAALHDVKRLITQYHFVPLDEITPCASFRLFQLLQVDFGILDTLVNLNGLDIRMINDSVMHQLLVSSTAAAATTTTTATATTTTTTTTTTGPTATAPSQANISTLLPRYLTHFKLTPSLLHTLLSNAPTPAILALLRPHPALLPTVSQVLHTAFGPTGHFTPSTALILSTYADILPPSLIEHCLFLPRTTGKQDGGSGYWTRCWPQPHPYTIWKHVMQLYGKHHVWSLRCFDDLVKWASEWADGRWTRLTRSHIRRGSTASAISFSSSMSNHATTTGNSGSKITANVNVNGNGSGNAAPIPGPWLHLLTATLDLQIPVSPHHLPRLLRLHGVCPLAPVLILSPLLTHPPTCPAVRAAWKHELAKHVKVKKRKKRDSGLCLEQRAVTLDSDVKPRSVEDVMRVLLEICSVPLEKHHHHHHHHHASTSTSSGLGSASNGLGCGVIGCNGTENGDDEEEEDVFESIPLEPPPPAPTNTTSSPVRNVRFGSGGSKSSSGSNSSSAGGFGGGKFKPLKVDRYKTWDGNLKRGWKFW
ncbi:hypothetical protein BC832DRAFT_609400 [Gaertneriomyces semiglobifer]|nr:hypothetical protein BC832DRAFT_609400 [Gaertneriomyces semiglobifer]